MGSSRSTSPAGVGSKRPRVEPAVEDDDEEGLIKDSPVHPGTQTEPAETGDLADQKSSKREKHRKEKSRDREKRDHKKRKHSHRDKEDRDRTHRRSKDGESSKRDKVLDDDADAGQRAGRATDNPPANAQDRGAGGEGTGEGQRAARDSQHERSREVRGGSRERDRGRHDTRQRDADHRGNSERGPPDRGLDRPRGARDDERRGPPESQSTRGYGGGREREREREPQRNRSSARERESERDRGGRAGDAGRTQGETGRQQGGRPGAQEGGPSAGQARAGVAAPAPVATEGGGGAAAQPAVAQKQEPLSLEELLKRRQEVEAEASRPKFMTKKQREEAALKKLHDSANSARQVHDAQRSQAHEAALRAAQEQREREAEDRRSDRVSAKEHEQQLELIRQQYLGKEKQKRRVAKASEKFRFNFDWDAKDDTSKDLNPLYNKLHDSAVLFGRGMLAGIDRREQLKEAAKKEQSTLQIMRGARGDRATAEEIEADSLRASRADKYDADNVKVQKHWTEKPREAMTERDWRIFREDHRISYKNTGKNAPNAYRSWDEMPLPSEIRRAITKLGYEKPSPIQMASIPYGLQNRDVIGLAETGSGKTAAFVIPMLVYIMGQPPMTEANCIDGPYSTVLAPTRELAQQIFEEASVLAEYTGFSSVCVVGGASYDEQAARLRRGAEIVVATPGRLVDCLNRRYAVLNQCNYIVLDEADRMVDMGFEPQVMQVLEAMPSTNLKPEDDDTVLENDRIYRTTYMFSATMPPLVERIARRYLRRPVTVTVGSAGRATDNVTQRVIWLTEKDKPRRLVYELDAFQATVKDELIKVIVFVNNKVHSEEVYNSVAALGKYKIALLHGGKSQEQREESIKGFREKEYDIMVATDVAGRGIDVRNVGLVINYDMPHKIENYTHRIGRTGRAGRKGVAITFLSNANTEVFYDLKILLEESKAIVPAELARHEASKIKPGGFEGTSRKDTVLYAS